MIASGFGGGPSAPKSADIRPKPALRESAISTGGATFLSKNQADSVYSEA